MNFHVLERYLNETPVRHIAVLTGAGISAESGIPTFREGDAFWRGMDPATFFTPEMLEHQPELSWRMYDELRQRAHGAQPNAGHCALGELASCCQLTLATQNIDGLHQRAGSPDVLELHGTLWRVRCDRCNTVEENHAVPLPDIPPHCATCGALLRPDIVLYSEALPAEPFARAQRAAEQCELMLVIGTSAIVYPAAALPTIAQEHGAMIIEINPRETPLTSTAGLALRAPAARVLPQLVTLLRTQADRG